MQATISRHTAHMREQSRVISRARRGIAEIRPAVIPSRIRVGGRETVRVELASTGIVQPFDPDFCVAQNIQAGLKVQARATVGGDQFTENFCLPASATGIGNPREFRVPVEGGRNPGELTVDIEVVGRDSGNLLAREQFTIQVVSEDAGDGGGIPGACQTDADCPPGMVCREGQCVQAPCRGLLDALTRQECSFQDVEVAGPQTQILVVLLIVVLVAAAA